VCDLETSRIGAPYIYDISSLRVNDLKNTLKIYFVYLGSKGIYCIFKMCCIISDWSFKTPQTTHPVTQHHIPEDLSH